jgi:hypothetical protein
MQGLKSLIKSKKVKTTLSNEASESLNVDAPGVSIDVVVIPNLHQGNSKKIKTRDAPDDREIKLSDQDLYSCLIEALPDFILPDSVFSPETNIAIDSYLDDMKIPRSMGLESDYMRLMRCRTEFNKLMKISDPAHVTTSSDEYQNDDTEVNPESDKSVSQISIKLDSLSTVPHFGSWVWDCISFATSSKPEKSGDYIQLQERTRQALDDLFELFCDLESQKVPDEVISNLDRIGSFCLNKKMKEAEEEYLKIAIGNQQWLIGVGNCFIQERSALDRIRNAKHLLNDARIRKYMQGVKRLISIWKEIIGVS